MPTPRFRSIRRGKSTVPSHQYQPRPRLIGHFLLLCSLVLVLGSCAPCEPDFIGRRDEHKPAEFSIVLGEGGGFAGTWQGYTITGNGVVFSWSGRGARENEQEIGLLAPDTLCALWDAVQPLSAVPSVDSSGSLVQFLTVAIQDSTRTYSWRPQLGVNLTRTTYQDLYHRCAVAIQTTITNATNTPTSKKK